MTSSEPFPPPSGGLQDQPRGNDERALGQAVSSMRVLLQLSVVALIIVVACSNVFLFHQVRLLRRQAAELQAGCLEMAKAVGEYETNTVPLMERFVTDLRKVAERNPDFAATLAKYPLPPPKSTNAAPVTSVRPVSGGTAPLAPATGTRR